MVCINIFIIRKVSEIVKKFEISILLCNEYLNVLVKTEDIVKKMIGKIQFYMLNPKKYKNLLKYFMYLKNQNNFL